MIDFIEQKKYDKLPSDLVTKKFVIFTGASDCGKTYNVEELIAAHNSPVISGYPIQIGPKGIIRGKPLIKQKTNKNSTSSRTHTIYQLKNKTVIVDLAGNERLNKSSNELITSGAFINSSLYAMKSVFKDQKEGKRPLYKSNILTRTLEPYLKTGVSTTVVLCYKNDTEEDIERAKYTFEFADFAGISFTDIPEPMEVDLSSMEVDIPECDSDLLETYLEIDVDELLEYSKRHPVEISKPFWYLPRHIVEQTVLGRIYNKLQYICYPEEVETWYSCARRHGLVVNGMFHPHNSIEQYSVACPEKKVKGKCELCERHL